ncbi:hypothetical protein F2Q68_00037196 [Brassica cretica]|uniref:Uncharacterized protein n=1 Tax=Brassica cretica TaxID=69181 RepID=A0A8S9GWA1_BRACR|nr:hypothetical protein F2Q68_00037196 [Brassica cretica]
MVSGREVKVFLEWRRLMEIPASRSEPRGRSVGTLTGGATWRVFHSWLESFMEWVFGSIIDKGVAMFPGGDGALLS